MIAITSRRTILTSTAGSCKGARYPHASRPALRLVSRRASLSTVCPRQRTRSHSSSTGNHSRARSTRARRCTQRPGPRRSSLVCTLHNIGTIWQKRYASLLFKLHSDGLLRVPGWLFGYSTMSRLACGYAGLREIDILQCAHNVGRNQRRPSPPRVRHRQR